MVINTLPFGSKVAVSAPCKVMSPVAANVPVSGS